MASRNSQTAGARGGPGNRTPATCVQIRHWVDDLRHGMYMAVSLDKIIDLVRAAGDMTTLEALAFWTLVFAVASYFIILVTSRFYDHLEAFYLPIFYILIAVVLIYASLEFSRPEAAVLGFAMLASIIAYSIHASSKSAGGA